MTMDRNRASIQGLEERGTSTARHTRGLGPTPLSKAPSAPCFGPALQQLLDLCTPGASGADRCLPPAFSCTLHLCAQRCSLVNVFIFCKLSLVLPGFCVSLFVLVHAKEKTLTPASQQVVFTGSSNSPPRNLCLHCQLWGARLAPPHPPIPA